MNRNKMKMSVFIICIFFILSTTFFMLFNNNSNYQANKLEMTKCFDKKAGISVVVEKKFLISNTTVSCEEN
ncbi:hypothetical protein FQ087_03895 [Sporosarcina sp. ANT_H38]|uniref:hypothetical protein n=1 Tax=Sporosarcina sp. ANT_H38 TaxID=2597358 RepID=UPI0011F15416|nr:hypothetical protein [Sporosarcina sp. ANT_H38]KAA0965458.1 hypothetical protein FQ087_03895 [Sporosarcina sp. ANT_H38]